MVLLGLVLRCGQRRQGVFGFGVINRGVGFSEAGFNCFQSSAREEWFQVLDSRLYCFYLETLPIFYYESLCLLDGPEGGSRRLRCAVARLYLEELFFDGSSGSTGELLTRSGDYSGSNSAVFWEEIADGVDFVFLPGGHRSGQVLRPLILYTVPPLSYASRQVARVVCVGGVEGAHMGYGDTVVWFWFGDDSGW